MESHRSHNTEKSRTVVIFLLEYFIVCPRTDRMLERVSVPRNCFTGKEFVFMTITRSADRSSAGIVSEENFPGLASSSQEELT